MSYEDIFWDNFFIRYVTYRDKDYDNIYILIKFVRCGKQFKNKKKSVGLLFSKNVKITHFIEFIHLNILTFRFFHFHWSRGF